MFLLLAGCCSANVKGSMSDHFDGKKFFNPGNESRKSFYDFLKWRFTSDSIAWPDWVDDVKQTVPKTKITSDVEITFINHATALIQTESANILTDPQFSDRTSPVSFAGPKRVRVPGVDIKNLPRIDVVLISHNHYDHLDIGSLKLLDQMFSPVFLVPLGDKKLLESEGIKKVVAMDWGERFEFPATEGAKTDDAKKTEQLQIFFEPSFHWSGRGMFDRNMSLWGSFVIKHKGKNIYFAGDTGYSEHFKQIFQKHGVMKVSLLPIGAYEPRWFMKGSHVNPEEAVKAHQDLQSENSIGIHFGTWKLTDEGIDDPITHLQQALTAESIAPNKFVAPKNGQVFSFSW